MSLKIFRALVLFVLVATTAYAGPHRWQEGTWRDLQVVAVDGGSVTMPTSPGVPTKMIGGVTVAGIPPTYATIPNTNYVEIVTIDGADGIRYVAQWGRHFTAVIINDEIDFAVEGGTLYVRGPKPGKDNKLTIVRRERLTP